MTNSQRRAAQAVLIVALLAVVGFVVYQARDEYAQRWEWGPNIAGLGIIAVIAVGFVIARIRSGRRGL